MFLECTAAGHLEVCRDGCEAIKHHLVQVELIVLNDKDIFTKFEILIVGQNRNICLLTKSVSE